MTKTTHKKDKKCYCFCFCREIKESEPTIKRRRTSVLVEQSTEGKVMLDSVPDATMDMDQVSVKIEVLFKSNYIITSFYW